MPDQKNFRTLGILQEAFPKKLFLSINDAAAALSRSPGALRNEISLGRFPVRTVKIGRRRLVPIISLAHYMDSLVDGKPQPGRPRAGSSKGVRDV